MPDYTRARTPAPATPPASPPFLGRQVALYYVSYIYIYVV